MLSLRVLLNNDIKKWNLHAWPNSKPYYLTESFTLLLTNERLTPLHTKEKHLHKRQLLKQAVDI